MPRRSSKMPRDVNQRAYTTMLIATGEAPPDEAVEPNPKKNPHAVALGKLGGAKGGKARAKALTKEQRTEIAVRAASRRWDKTKK